MSTDSTTPLPFAPRDGAGAVALLPVGHPRGPAARRSAGHAPKAAETTPGFRLVGDAAISADELGWSCALIDGVLEFETPTLDECAWLSRRLAECGKVDAVELFASKALGAWGELREPATPYADDRWDFDVDALRRDGYAILRGAAPSGAAAARRTLALAT
ncbi:protein serine/threonine phosphatase [Aureococcus anophagefferens]|nr:protein serine/threonine phosphatase [Aureococcus anophagefferens]